MKIDSELNMTGAILSKQNDDRIARKTGLLFGFFKIADQFREIAFRLLFDIFQIADLGWGFFVATFPYFLLAGTRQWRVRIARGRFVEAFLPKSLRPFDLRR